VDVFRGEVIAARINSLDVTIMVKMRCMVILEPNSGG
jgi:hypothetical protein